METGRPTTLASCKLRFLLLFSLLSILPCLMFFCIPESEQASCPTTSPRHTEPYD